MMTRSVSYLFFLFLEKIDFHRKCRNRYTHCVKWGRSNSENSVKMGNVYR